MYLFVNFFANSNIDWPMNPRISHHKVRTPQLYLRVKSITILCFLCSLRYSAIRIKNCSKSTSVITVATMKIWWCCAPQLLSETEVSISLLCQLCLTCHTAVQIKNCLKSTRVLKIATMKIQTISRYAKKAITCNHLFTVSKDEWNTKEDTGKSIYHVHTVKKNIISQVFYTWSLKRYIDEGRSTDDVSCLVKSCALHT